MTDAPPRMTSTAASALPPRRDKGRQAPLVAGRLGSGSRPAPLSEVDVREQAVMHRLLLDPLTVLGEGDCQGRIPGGSAVGPRRTGRFGH
ncbi:hypothetical protein [Streptomyces massasporeus]|uniref:hypothetical protein n=1 Tax=Streptomyces massasporeus TaxID=67324 RepID=UPI00382846B5